MKKTNTKLMKEKNYIASHVPMAKVQVTAADISVFIN